MATTIQSVNVPEKLKPTEQKPKYKIGRFFQKKSKLLIIDFNHRFFCW